MTKLKLSGLALIVGLAVLGGSVGVAYVVESSGRVGLLGGGGEEGGGEGFPPPPRPPSAAKAPPPSTP
jgi:hypothetical protein